MEVVTRSPEYHFLDKMSLIAKDPGHWAVIEINFSGINDVSNLAGVVQNLPETLENLDTLSDNYLEQLKEKLKSYPDTLIYKFSDKDILAIVDVQDNASGEDLKKIYKSFQEFEDDMDITYGVMAFDHHKYKKLADIKFLTAHKIEALQDMSDVAKLDTIELRRSNRDLPVFLVIEDDSFTANYVTNLLSKEFEVITARSGEEGICKYIEYAPNGVFLDINLQGITGQQTLDALK